MADEEDPKAEDSAEKAYAAAAEAAPNKSDPETETDKPTEPAPAQSGDIAPGAREPESVDTPAKTKGGPKAAPAAEAPVKATAPAPAASAVKSPTRPALPKRRKPAKRPTKVSIGRASQATAQPAEPVAPRSAPAAKSKTAAKKAAAKAAKPKAPAVLKTHAMPKFKEQQMDNPQVKETKTEKPGDYTQGFQKVVSDTQKEAKSAFEKSTALIGEYTDFAKGNVEALLESGKILATGLQDMGSTLFAESRSAVETVTADAKQLASAKSPAEFVKLQSEILRRNFDSAVALTSKNSEIVLKLASDTFAPISGRVSLAVEKLRKAA